MKREYWRNGKPVIHQTTLKEHFICPKRAEFSINPDFETETTEAMANGLMVESLLFGFKGKNEEERKKYEDKIVGVHKTKPSQVRFRQRAQKCANILEEGKYFPEDGQAFVKLEYEDDNAIYQIEFDWYTPEKFFDLKVTTDMLKVWGFVDWKGDYKMPTKYEMLQPIYYTWVYFKAMGGVLEELPPWDFIIIDWNYFIVKVLPTYINKFDFNWLEDRLIDYQSDLFKKAKPSFNACYKNKYNQKCPYLSVCKEGKEFLKGELNEINFDFLPG